VHELYRHLAACDLAVIQGGLTTAMELTASRRPFIYFPLEHHFEQNYRVRHRLDRYRAGRCMDYATARPDDIASAIATEIGRQVDYRPVSADGAARAASMLAELLSHAAPVGGPSGRPGAGGRAGRNRLEGPGRSGRLPSAYPVASHRSGTVPL
jgi:predicted glycosyltransferase